MDGMDFKIIDSHSHPGYEKKDIEKRPGCTLMWFGAQNPSSAMIRAALGDPEPWKPITKIEEIPDFGVDYWIKYMDDMGISHMGLQAMDTESDPPLSWRWQVPYEYVKEEFIDKYPDRFWGIGGIHYKLGPEHSLEQVEKAKEFGFPGVKMFTVLEGYPNDREKCYPIYERCVKLGLHVEFHVGVEDVPGARFKYSDPIYIQDVAMDFPDLKIVMLHCGFFLSPERAVGICAMQPNVYTDITNALSIFMDLKKYTYDLEHLRVLEQFIPDKVWYGSDFPVTHAWQKTTIARLKDLPLGAEFKRKLLRDNAAKFFLGKTPEMLAAEEVTTPWSRVDIEAK
jgi:predicted TIM-barrel fold metal-dependent hydrolase